MNNTLEQNAVQKDAFKNQASSFKSDDFKLGFEPILVGTSQKYTTCLV